MFIGGMIALFLLALFSFLLGHLHGWVLRGQFERVRVRFILPADLDEDDGVFVLSFLYGRYIGRYIPGFVEKARKMMR